jgi:diguanylate cyclase (GGDEF)-like protein
VNIRVAVRLSLLGLSSTSYAVPCKLSPEVLVPHRPPTRSDWPDASLYDSLPGSPRARAAERGELDRATVVPPGVLDLITRDLAAGLAAEAVLLALRDRESVVLLSTADSARAVDPAVLAEGKGFVGRALKSGRTAAGPVDALNDPSLGPLGAGGRVTHAIGAPVTPPKGPVGVLCAGFSAPPAGGSSALWVVESYARLAALCLHDRSVLQSMLRAAREDALTGCLSFASLLKELSRETRRAARYRHELSVCFIDLDRFKRVNDLHGHTQGNRVLVEVAAALRACVRAGDALGRYGGDEFVAILPETAEAEARVLAERVRAKISAATALSASEPVDASVGIAHWSPGLSPEAILGDADRALLVAKAGGGGIVAASELDLEPAH